MKILIVVLVLFANFVQAKTDKTSRNPASFPLNNVMVGGATEFDACPGTGIVLTTTTLMKFDKTGELQFDKANVNTIAFICQTTPDEDYIGIVFGNKNQDCKVSSPIKTKQEYKGPCKSGWIKKDFFKVLEG